MGCGGSRQAADTAISYVHGGDSTVGPRTFIGAHSDMINGVAAGCAVGEWISCAEDKTVALTDWHSGRVVQTWRGHERGVNRVLAAPHADGALTCSRDTTVRLWKRGQEAPVTTYAGHELSVSAIALSEDGGQAMSGSRDSSLRVWDVAAGSCAARCHVSRNVVTCLAWVAGEGHLVAQGSEDLRLRLWDVRTLSQPAAQMEGAYVYFPLCVATVGHYVITGSNGFDSTGCELRIWDRRTNKQPLGALAGHAQAVQGVAVVAGGGGGGGLLACSGSKDGQLRLWDVTSGECLDEMRLADGSGVSGVAAARADEMGSQLYVSTTSGDVHAVSVKGGALEVVATGGPGDKPERL